MLNAWAILSLPSTSNPLATLDDKVPNLVLFCVRGWCRPKLTLACVVAACFVGIMGDFAWRPLVKQVEPTGGIVPLFVSPIVIVAKVTPNAPSSALAKRK